jgi:hypothetical protein
MKNRQNQGCNQKQVRARGCNRCFTYEKEQKVTSLHLFGHKGGKWQKNNDNFAERSETAWVQSHRASITNDPAYGKLLRLRITESRD